MMKLLQLFVGRISTGIISSATAIGILLPDKIVETVKNGRLLGLPLPEIESRVATVMANSFAGNPLEVKASGFSYLGGLFMNGVNAFWDAFSGTTSNLAYSFVSGLGSLGGLAATVMVGLVFIVGIGVGIVNFFSSTDLSEKFFAMRKKQDDLTEKVDLVKSSQEDLSKKIESVKSSQEDTIAKMDSVFVLQCEMAGNTNSTKTKVESLEPKIDSTQTKVDSIETKIDTTITKVNSIETKMDTIHSKVEIIQTSQDELINKVNGVDSGVQGLLVDQKAIKSELDSSFSALKNFIGFAKPALTNILSHVTTLDLEAGPGQSGDNAISYISAISEPKTGTFPSPVGQLQVPTYSEPHSEESSSGHTEKPKNTASGAGPSSVARLSGSSASDEKKDGFSLAETVKAARKVRSKNLQRSHSETIVIPRALPTPLLESEVEAELDQLLAKDLEARFDKLKGKQKAF